MSGAVADVKPLLRPAFAEARTPAQHRALAEQLEALAAELRQLAQALERQQRRPPAERVAPRGGKGGRPSSAWVRIERRANPRGADVLRIKLSRSLYYEARSPQRLVVQLVGGALRLTPADGDDGYAVTVSAGGISINASGMRDYIAHEDGRYAAEVRGGVIVVGAALKD